MQGKRSYWVLRKFLLQASEGVETKGLRLAERVFIPEHFSRDHAAEIAERRDQALSILLSPDPDLHFKMMIAVGELKAFNEVMIGYQIYFKHLPECAFFLEEAAGARTKRAFESALLAWSAGQVKLIAACLFYAKRERLYQIESLTLMMASDAMDTAWTMPTKSPSSTSSSREQRTFIKPLRYEAKYASHFPNLQLLDVGAQPVALDILSAFLTPQERAAKVSGIAARGGGGWVWDTARRAVMPDLPPKAVHRMAIDAAAVATTPSVTRPMHRAPARASVRRAARSADHAACLVSNFTPAPDQRHRSPCVRSRHASDETGNPLGVMLRVARRSEQPVRRRGRVMKATAATADASARPRSSGSAAAALQGRVVAVSCIMAPANRASATTSPATKSPRSSAPPRKARATARATTR